MGFIEIPARSRGASPAMAIAGEKLERIHDFLQRSFLPSEFHMFLTFMDDDLAFP
jgi:hypothetical protein